MIHGLINLCAPDVAWVLHGRLALPSPPAALVPPPRQCPPLHPPRRLVVFRRSGPSAHPACPRPGSRPARDASRSRFGCCDSLSNALAIRGCATPLRVQVSRCIAVDAPGRAVPLRCLAFQILRRSNLRRALPSPCHVSLCLRQALLRKATPSLPVSVHRRRMPRLCFAVACAALLLSAVAVPGTSWPSHSMLCSSFARLTIAKPLRCYSKLISACPSPRLSPQLRSMSAPGRAKPSRHGASFGSSVATLRNAPPSRRYSGSDPSSGPCRCCATGRCRGTGRSRAIPARAASPTCS